MSQQLDTASNPTPPAQRPWVAWGLGLLAVPVLYLLSAPPLFLGMSTDWGKNTFPQRPPRWVVNYNKPYVWACVNTPLGGPLELYTRWWERRFPIILPTVPVSAP